MTHIVRFSRGASKDLRRLPAAILRRVEQALLLLKENPFPAGHRLLFGYTNVYRIRVGDYRVVYEVGAQIRIITILRIRHRKEVYKNIG